MAGKRYRSASNTRRARRRLPMVMNRRRKSRPMRRRRYAKASIRRSIPDFTMVALPYSEHIQMSSLTTNPSQGYKYQLNSMNDFRNAFGGHQPLGFDQYSAFFQKYRVHATKIKVTWYDPSGLTGSEIRCALYPARHNTNLSASSAFSILDELPMAKVAPLVVTGGGKWRTTIKAFYKMHRLQGVSKTEYNTDLNYEAYIDNDPGSMPLLYILAWDPNATTGGGTGTVWFNIQATFYASIFGRKPLTQS